MPRTSNLPLSWGVWVEPRVGIEPATFSLRVRTSSSHLLSTSAFGHTAAPAHARFPMSIHDFVPRVMPWISTTVGCGSRLVEPEQVRQPTF